MAMMYSFPIGQPSHSLGVTCYITTDRVKRKVVYLQTQKFK